MFYFEIQSLNNSAVMLDPIYSLTLRSTLIQTFLKESLFRHILVVQTFPEPTRHPRHGTLFHLQDIWLLPFILRAYMVQPLYLSTIKIKILKSPMLLWYLNLCRQGLRSRDLVRIVFAALTVDIH